MKGIEKAAVRASDLTSQLLTYGRKGESHFRSVDLNQVKINPDAKVMIASGYSAEEPKAEAMKAGARGFISKPYAIKKILKAVRALMDAG